MILQNWERAKIQYEIIPKNFNELTEVQSETFINHDIGSIALYISSYLG